MIHAALSALRCSTEPRVDREIPPPQIRHPRALLEQQQWENPKSNTYAENGE
jgi:hypothetical protein